MHLHIMFSHGSHAVTLDGEEADLLLEELGKPNPQKIMRFREWVIVTGHICHIRIDPDE